MDYLCSELDDETDCLHILHGDWNDAIDRLGATNKSGKRWGNGVTVMASAQMYRNCRELVEILTKVGGYDDLIAKYTVARKRLENGLLKNSIDVNENGEKRILHGWGDDRSYFLGSFNDPDGVSRISSTAHSMWAICGMTEKDNSTKEVVHNAFKTLNSKYGLLTFDKPFLKDSYNYFGRISTITPGIAENFAAYIHSSIFGSMALFEIGESKMAWEQIDKSIVITHDNCSKTPFVMPNSYCYNPDYTIDGESMGDWYTGSGTTLIKELVGYGFGIKPNLDGIKIEFPNYFPANEAEIELKIKGKNVKVAYKNTNSDGRTFTVNGKTVTPERHELANTKYIVLSNEDITENTVIEITD
jgi:cellobiose phosphorylase